MKNLFRGAAAVMMATVIVCSCSTTSKIPADDLLYTGIKKVDIARSDSGRIPADLADQIYEAVNVPPNNYIKMLDWRYPFPLGLCV